MKVEIRPIEKERFHLNKGKTSIAKPKIISAVPNLTTGKYETGLTENEIKELSAKLQGFDLSDTYNHDEPHPFWEAKISQVKLENCTMFLDTTKPMDYIKWKIMRASKRVANSKKEANDNILPEATHYIHDEEEAEEEKVAKMQLKEQVYALMAGLPASAKARFVLILSDTKRKVSDRSPNFINAEMYTLAETKPKELLEQLKRPKEDIKIESDIIMMSMHDIINRESGGYFYMGELLGHNLAATVLWFKETTNVTLKTILISKLEEVNKVAV